MDKVVLHKGRESSWHFGHPWIFSRAIHTPASSKPGSFISLYSHENKFLGLGSYHPKNTIAVRMWTRRREKIDTGWLVQKFEALQKQRKALIQATAYRLAFAESDGLPGLVIDLYADTAAIQVETKAVELLLPQIREALHSLNIVEHSILGDSMPAKKEGVMAHSPLTKVVRAEEEGLQIFVPLGGQKTGWFCDQRENRVLIRELVRKTHVQSVLNLFSYTGGFSLSSLQGGAKRAVNVDRDKESLDLFSQMIEANELEASHEEIVLDVWQYLRSSSEQFDLVIVDPPAFTKERNKKEAALKGYLDLFKMSIARVRPGGFLVVCSCSYFVGAEDLAWVLRQAYALTGRWFQTVRYLTQALDHPVPAFFPEGLYLKGYLLQEISLL